MARPKLRPHQKYIELARLTSVICTEPKQQLLILDLNGVLASRNRRSSVFYTRPYTDVFLDYIFSEFTVMVWSSARPQSVDFMCRMFGRHREKIAVMWDRTSLGLSPGQYQSKVQTVKDLDKVWAYFGYSKFNPMNTIMIDDSADKLVLQPYNVIHPSEFEHGATSFLSSGDSQLIQIVEYLKKARYQSNIPNYFFCNPFRPLMEAEDNSFSSSVFTMSKGNESSIVDFASKHKTGPIKL
ncbi:HAD-like domain-containing protein [Sporodiniella umbellata]|nr:HAD-like domain-containing protein [Sporodiniella umbellata]